LTTIRSAAPTPGCAPLAESHIGSAQMIAIARSPALFPSFVVQYSLHLNAAEMAEVETHFAGIPQPASIANASPRRRFEYLAGRYCARQALRTCTPELANAEISRGMGREPVWPPGIVGSISHTNNLAWAAVAQSCHARSIGLDVEVVLTTKVANGIVDIVASRDEITRLQGMTGWSVARLVTLVFSAKETVFKCLYPEVGRSFEFRDLLLTAIDNETGSFQVLLARELSSELPTGRALHGRFELMDSLVYTGMLLTP
jgi:enterobactin synthetase component D